MATKKTAQAETKTDNATLGDKLKRLDELVEWFNNDDFALEDAVAKFKEADALAREIEDDLGKIKNDINVLSERFDA